MTFDDGITEEFSLDLASGCSAASAVCRGAFSWTSCDGVGREDGAEGATETKAPKSALLEAARPPAPQDSSSRAAIICRKGSCFSRAGESGRKCHCRLHDCLPDEPLLRPFREEGGPDDTGSRHVRGLPSMTSVVRGCVEKRMKEEFSVRDGCLN